MSESESTPGPYTAGMTPSGIEAATLRLEAQCLSAIYNAFQFNTCQQVKKNKTFSLHTFFTFVSNKNV